MTISGGPVFWILLVMAVASFIIFFERLIDLRRARIDYQDFLKGVTNVLDAGNDSEALSICEGMVSPIANVVATAIRHSSGSARTLREAVDSQGRAEINRLDRRLASLAIMAQVAPLLGLLGTIIAFIRTVVGAGSVEAVCRVEVMNGVVEAMTVAAMGLAVAVALTVMYGALRVRLDRIVSDLEASASQIIGYIAARKDPRK